MTLTTLEVVMIGNYARLIQRELKKIEDVPNNLKSAVEAKLKEVDSQ